MCFFVDGDNGGGFPAGARNGDGSDLGGEETFCGGFLGFLDGADGVVVLGGAVEAVVAGAFFAM